ncbi:hypothetical protein PHLCEN_2v9831 [Hermanssonia centrifuga]|uniref:Uncharacterized protein n=1 Tax=Hermanssonia centrifuga TaxID=98765 RepID=A0A2R6NQD4_9APHY|nr:hypothetical protein PHLCEN_2v9831 [Hermanssonia centrifuga]
MPRITAEQHPAESVITMGTPKACAAKPDDSRPTKLPKFKITSWREDRSVTLESGFE